MKFFAIIAHDGKKPAMLEWSRRHREFLSSRALVATGTTGALVEHETGLSIRKMLSGPLGGDLQIGALVATGEIEAIVFLRDPLMPHPHEPDISALTKVCDTHNVPLATNVATADLLVAGMSQLSQQDQDSP